MSLFLAIKKNIGGLSYNIFVYATKKEITKLAFFE